MAILERSVLIGALIDSHAAGEAAAAALNAKDASERARLRARSDELYHGAWRALGLMPDPSKDDR